MGSLNQRDRVTSNANSRIHTTDPARRSRSCICCPAIQVARQYRFPPPIRIPPNQLDFQASFLTESAPTPPQRPARKKTYRPHGEMNAPPARMESWGRQEGDLHYSLEVVQHPLRARMCGFGDKDRRPLAPAAVAKMIVRRQDETVVDADDIDIAFFLVTVDLWSESGTEEMNLVLHPSSGGHATSSYPNRRIKRPPTTAYNVPPPGHYDPQTTPAPVPTGYPSRQEGPYPPRGPEETAGYPQRPDAAYGAPRSEGAGYAGRPDDSHTQTQYTGGYEEPRGSWPPHYPPPGGFKRG
ncbi:hypothetical protein OPQ81_004584 [Rhizoctonia solani]|nr:hypothetical protein OPQ81_004584 [Rhizoctonia solani]